MVSWTCPQPLKSPAIPLESIVGNTDAQAHTHTQKHIWRPSLTSCWNLLQLTIFSSIVLPNKCHRTRTIFTVTNIFRDIRLNKKKCHQRCLVPPSKKHSKHFPSTWASSCTVLFLYPLHAHTFKKTGSTSMESQKLCIWLSGKAVRVPVKSLNHEPQASRTWQARLESALNKMLGGVGG